MQGSIYGQYSKAQPSGTRSNKIFTPKDANKYQRGVEMLTSGPLSYIYIKSQKPDGHAYSTLVNNCMYAVKHGVEVLGISADCSEDEAVGYILRAAQLNRSITISKPTLLWLEDSARAAYRWRSKAPKIGKPYGTAQQRGNVALQQRRFRQVRKLLQWFVREYGRLPSINRLSRIARTHFYTAKNVLQHCGEMIQKTSEQLVAGPAAIVGQLARMTGIKLDLVMPVNNPLLPRGKPYRSVEIVNQAIELGAKGKKILKEWFVDPLTGQYCARDAYLVLMEQYNALIPLSLRQEFGL